MGIGATSLSMVRDELFATMAETQQYLEQFLDARDNGALLQHAVTNLQQIKGILSLVELTGAELLAEEAHTLTMDIPVGATEERNEQLTAINNALHVLRSYLEQLEANWIEMPELLLPAINKLRSAGQQSLEMQKVSPCRDACVICIKLVCLLLFVMKTRRPACV